MQRIWFWCGAIALVLAALLMTRVVANQYYYFAGYVVLQYVVLASAWNILGGYAGYVNFGTSAFFALGAYTSIVLLKIFGLSLPLLILGGAIISGAVGLGTAYLTLRLRGIFFAIATLALSVVLETFIVNWDFVGGSSGVYITRPQDTAFFDDYIKLLFMTMLLLAIAAAAIARGIERSRLGRGLAAIRDNELAAEAMGVPTLRLKVIATITSGMLMGAAGAPFPYYLTYIQPASVFSLEYTVNSIAMPLIGGTTTWVGPVIGAIILGVAQQITTVTISSELNLLIVGALLIAFVVLAPKGIVGFLRSIAHSRN